MKVLCFFVIASIVVAKATDINVDLTEEFNRIAAGGAEDRWHYGIYLDSLMLLNPPFEEQSFATFLETLDV